jgi:hypothetical protein
MLEGERREGWPIFLMRVKVVLFRSFIGAIYYNATINVLPYSLCKKQEDRKKLSLRQRNQTKKILEKVTFRKENPDTVCLPTHWSAQKKPVIENTHNGLPSIAWSSSISLIFLLRLFRAAVLLWPLRLRKKNNNLSLPFTEVRLKPKHGDIAMAMVWRKKKQSRNRIWHFLTEERKKNKTSLPCVSFMVTSCFFSNIMM